jgi:hypothetical protein
MLGLMAIKVTLAVDVHGAFLELLCTMVELQLFGHDENMPSSDLSALAPVMTPCEAPDH